MIEHMQEKYGFDFQKRICADCCDCKGEPKQNQIEYICDRTKLPIGPHNRACGRIVQR